RILYRENSSSDWNLTGDHDNAIDPVIKRDNISIMEGHFCSASTTDCTIPSTSVIAGSDSECKNATGVVYYVTENGGSTYDWTITGGSQTSGSSTHTITVKWGSTGMTGSVEVVETNACGSGSPVTKSVNIHPVPLSSITGEQNVFAGSTSNSYSVTENSDYTYNWTVTGGSITGGQTAHEIIVTWGSAGTGQVIVNATNDVCGLTTSNQSISVTISDEIYSVQSGNWNDANTWNVAYTPTSTHNVRIKDGHTVTLIQNETVNKLYIEQGGYINQAAFYFDVYGNYTNDGTHYISQSNRLRLYGVGTTIGGTGLIDFSNIGYFTYIYSGNKTIPAGTNLTINGGLYINDAGITITNNGNLTVNYRLYGPATTSWINAENSFLEVKGDGVYSLMYTGTLVASATGNTIKYGRAGVQSIIMPQNNDYYNLIIAGSYAKTLRGDIRVLNDLTIASELATANYDIKIRGNWTNTGVFTPGTGSVRFRGTANQTITKSGGEQFYNLVINKSSGTITLANNVKVTNTLTFTSGTVNSGTKKLTLGTSKSSIGTLNYTAGKVIGKFERFLSSTSIDYLFPTGSSTDYRPMTVNFNSLAGGSLIAQFVSANPGNNGLVPLNDGGTNVYHSLTEGYWKFEPANSLASTNYNLALTGTGMTSYTINADTRLITRTNSSSDWTAKGTHGVNVSNTVKRTGINLLGAEYALGDITNCTSPVTSIITGSQTVCKNESASVYYVTDYIGSSYQWTITGGTQATGTLTNSISVTWGSVGMAGKVKVLESNSCGSDDPVTLDVNIHPLPVSDISGTTTVSEST
ncbi:MAG: hypothetical protein V1904_13655, partial [Bacteroidota bacterium]